MRIIVEQDIARVETSFIENTGLKTDKVLTVSTDIFSGINYLVIEDADNPAEKPVLCHTPVEETKELWSKTRSTDIKDFLVSYTGEISDWYEIELSETEMPGHFYIKVSTQKLEKSEVENEIEYV